MMVMMHDGGGDGDGDNDIYCCRCHAHTLRHISFKALKISFTAAQWALFANGKKKRVVWIRCFLKPTRQGKCFLFSFCLLGCRLQLILIS